jgi:phasin
MCSNRGASLALTSGGQSRNNELSRADSANGAMAMDQMKGFEIPADMRKFAEQSVEQARKAFDTFIGAAQQAVSEMEGRATAAREGAKDVGEKAMSFAEKNLAASFDLAKSLVRAKDVEEIVKIQTEYVKSQMQHLSEQAKELSQSATKIAMDAGKPKS